MTYQSKDEFLCGVLIALGFVYEEGQATLAERIVAATGPYALLRVAKKNEDISLPNLRKTIRDLADAKTWLGT
jgi:hypothetical protein